MEKVNMMSIDSKSKIDIYTSMQEQEQWVEYVVFSNNGEMLALCCGLNVSIWNVNEINKEFCFPHKDIVWKCVFSKNDDTLYSTTSDGCLYIWNLMTLENVNICQIHKDCVFGITVHPARDIIATCSADNTITCFCCTNQKIISTLKGHSMSVEDVCFSPCGEILASCSKDKTILLWKNCFEESNLQAYSLTGHRKWINMCKFCPNGKLLGSVSSDKRIGIWSVERHCLLRFLLGHNNVIWGLTFIPALAADNPPFIVSCSSDKTLR